MDCPHCACVDLAQTCLALVVGVVRLYLEPDERRKRVVPSSFVPIIDCNPEQAQELRRRLTRQGYSIIAVPL